MQGEVEERGRNESQEVQQRLKVKGERKERIKKGREVLLYSSGHAENEAHTEEGIRDKRANPCIFSEVSDASKRRGNIGRQYDTWRYGRSD